MATLEERLSAARTASLQDRLTRATETLPERRQQLEEFARFNPETGETQTGIRTPGGGSDVELPPGLQRERRVQSMLEGLTFGALDDIDAVLRDKGIISSEATSIKDLLKTAPPGERLAGNVLGGLGGGVAAVKALPKAFSTIPRIAASGAVEGGLAGAGFAEGGIAERAEGAVTGAALGGTLGLVIPGAVKGVSALIARASSKLPAGQRFAVDRVLRELKRGGITPEEAIDKVRKLGPKGMFADVPELRDLSRAVAGVPGPGAQRAKGVLEARAAAARDRITAVVRRVVSAENFGEFQAALVSSREEVSKQLYGEARAFGVLQPSEALTKVFKSSAVKSAAKEVKNINPDLDLDDLDMNVLDAVYKRLVEKSFGSGAAKGQLTAVKNQLKDAISEQVPIYREAVDTFAGRKSIEEALDQGRKALREDDFVTARIIQEMTEGEKEAFIVGLARAATDAVDKGTQRANVAARLFSRQNERKLRAAFGARRLDFKAFKEAMLKEMEFAETTNAVLRGSRTAPLQEGQRDLLRDAGRVTRAVERVAERRPIAAVEELARGRATKPPLTEAESKAMGQLLFQQQVGLAPGRSGPGELGRLLTQRQTQQMPGQLQTIVQGSLPAALVAATQGGQRFRRPPGR